MEKCHLADLITELGFSSLSLRRTKNEAELSLRNICHALWIVLLQMNGKKAKLGQFPDLFLDYAVERRNHLNARIILFGFEDCFAKQNTVYTLLISRGTILNIKFMTSFAESNLSSCADFITFDPYLGPCLQFWCTWYLVTSHIPLAAVVE